MDDFIKSNAEHVKETYLDSANNLLNFSMIVFAFSFITYFIALLSNNFDFGLIFELIAFVLILITKNRIKNGDTSIAKICVIASILPVIFLIGFDLLNLILNLGEVFGEVFHYYTSIDQFFYMIEPYLFDITLVVNIVLLFKAFISLKYAEGSVEKTYTDKFYDSL